MDLATCTSMLRFRKRAIGVDPWSSGQTHQNF